MDIQGNFQAQITDYGLSETKAGLAQVWVEFGFMYGDKPTKLTWYGSFKDGAKDITLKALLTMGLPQQAFSSLHLMNNGLEARMLNTQKMFDITVDMQPDQNQKMKPRVQWINDPENPTFTQKRLDQAGVAKHIQGLNFSGDLIKLANEMGLGNGQQQNQNQNQNQGQNQNQQNNQGQNQNYNNGGYNQNQNQGQQSFDQNQNQNFQNNQQYNNGPSNQQHNGNMNGNYNGNSNQSNQPNGGQQNGNFAGNNGGGQQGGNFKAPF